MDGQYVYAGIATMFFRKVNPDPDGGTQVDSYKLVKGYHYEHDVFVLEVQPK